MNKRFIVYTALFLLFFFFDLTFGYSVRNDYLESVTAPIPLRTTDISNNLSNFDTYSSFDATIDRFIKQWGVAGASVAVAKHGKLVYAKGFGYSNIEANEKMQPYHMLRVASVSKLITATAVMKLVENDELSLTQKVFGEEGILNDPIYSDYIDKRVEDITVKNLLNHSGGWTARWGDHLFMPQSIARQTNKELPLCKDDIISFALAKRLHFKPGLRSSYSNLGYLILERLIEKVSGTSYEKYVQQNIFQPIGVFDAFIAHNYDSLRYPLEVRYYEVPEAKPVPAFDGQSKLVLKSRGGNDVRTLGAAGGWVISTISLTKFLVAIDMYSEGTILSKRSIRTLTKTEPGFHPLGWRWVSKDGTKWRTGTLAGTSALAISRTDGFTFVFITNSSPWIGARFPYEVNRMMSRAMQNVDYWPDVDIFNPTAHNYSYFNASTGLTLDALSDW